MYKLYVMFAWTVTDKASIQLERVPVTNRLYIYTYLRTHARTIRNAIACMMVLINISFLYQCGAYNDYITMGVQLTLLK